MKKVLENVKLENAKRFFLNTVVSFSDKLIDITYRIRDLVTGSFVLVCMSEYAPLEYLIICLLVVVLFSIVIRWANKKRRITRSIDKKYVHEDERGNLYIRVEDLNEVVEFVYQIERGEK